MLDSSEDEIATSALFPMNSAVVIGTQMGKCKVIGYKDGDILKEISSNSEEVGNLTIDYENNLLFAVGLDKKATVSKIFHNSKKELLR
jgi:hypothetical protein